MFLPSDSMITPLVSARDRHAHETPVTAGETALALAGMSDMLVRCMFHTTDEDLFSYVVIAVFGTRRSLLNQNFCFHLVDF